ncbi:MAG TPA: hypothetical protein VE911_12370 [Candidatus Nitrosopolaris sp.]|nr:hypothetical protein [Candidatus Nitrosopolaris sp.]
MRGRVVVAVLGLVLWVGGCARHEAPLFTGEPFLVVWAGDADRQNSDFLAVLDADPTSASYGKVLRTYPVRSRGNEPNLLTAVPRPDRLVFATALLTSRTFVFDLRQPLAGRLLHVDEPDARRRLWAPQEPVSLPNGYVAIACSDPAGYRGDPREVVTAAGGLLELNSDGRRVRETSAADPTAHGFLFAPCGAALVAGGARIVTASTAHGYAASTQGERMPGIGVQIWKVEDLTLVKTIGLEAGPRGEENLGPLTARAMRQKPIVYVNTEGGGVYASDSIQTEVPSFRLVYDFGAGVHGGGAALTPDDRYYVVALPGKNRVASLDVADPWKPRPISSVRFDRDPMDSSRSRRGGPDTLTMSADGTRIAVSDYTVDVPGFFQDGDHRVYMMRLDPATGRLRIDGAFVDELTGEVGVNFNRTRWPHGETGPARPKGLLLVTPEPPPAPGK